MKKSPFFSVSAGALLLGLLIYFSACIKEPVTPAGVAGSMSTQTTGGDEPVIIPTIEGEAVDRGCSPCVGTLTISNNAFENTPFHAQLQSRACRNLAWTTELTLNGNAPFSDPTFQVSHEKFYRIILTNDGTKLRTFSSTIVNPPGYGFISAVLGTIPPGQTVVAEYNGKGNCGCGWIYDCSKLEE